MRTETGQRLRLFASPHNDVKYVYGRPLKATRETLRMVSNGQLGYEKQNPHLVG
jgi:hypothetical protein